MEETSIYKFPETVVDTKFGRAIIWSTGLDHIGIRDLEVATDKPDAFVVNGVRISARVDLHRREDGAYRAGTDDTPYHRYGALIARREGGGDVSDSARRKLLDEAERVVAEFMETDEGEAFVRVGEAKRLAQESARLERELAEVEAKLAEVRAKASENALARVKLGVDPSEAVAWPRASVSG